ncbi:MAG: glutathionylspermidine synthase family protein [Peptoniphilus sp.]|nr:glutathionylspermidine synthase family protein [Peptoniphilus sp.]
MYNDKYVEDFYEIVKEDPEKYHSDYLSIRKKIKKDFKDNDGKIMNNLYQGYFYSKKEWDNYYSIAKTLMSITKKVIKNYVEDEEYRKLFGFPEKLEELILHDPGYDIPVPMCRYDMFYDNEDDFMFLEFNTDGTSAMNEDKIIGENLFASKAMREFNKKHDVRTIDLFTPWVEKSTAIYEAKLNKKPNIAIVDFLELATMADFKMFKDYYKAAGYNCEICDIRDLTYEKGNLMCKDYKIDLVYRRFVALEFMKHYDEVTDFIKAYLDNAFMMLGSFRTHIMHEKKTFKVLHDEKTFEILSPEEVEFIKNHIPFTAMLEPKVADKIKGNKDEYIIKPIDGYMSTGVAPGQKYDQEEWNRIVDEALDEEYIYQKFYNSKPLSFVEFDEEGKAQRADYGAVIGLYIFAEEFSGLYVRIGKQSVIGGFQSTYFIAPNMYIDCYNAG